MALTVGGNSPEWQHLKHHRLYVINMNSFFIYIYLYIYLQFNFPFTLYKHECIYINILTIRSLSFPFVKNLHAE